MPPLGGMGTIDVLHCDVNKTSDLAGAAERLLVEGISSATYIA
jgi:hypothetical protein